MTNCFGHDGSTGAYAWVDVDKKIVIGLLNNRGHPDVKNNKYFSDYRERITDAILEALGY